MKHIYKKPEINIQHIVMEGTLLSGSPSGGRDTDRDPKDPEKPGGGGDVSTDLGDLIEPASKGNSFWDDWD